MKILWVTNLMSPYRNKFFEILGEENELTVYLEHKNVTYRNDSWISNTSINFKLKYFRGIHIKNYFIPLGLDKILNEHYDHIVISNYSTLTGMLMIEKLKDKKRDFIIEVDGGFISKENKFKKRLKTSLLGSATTWLSSGEKTDEYLTYYGAKEEKISHYPFTSLEHKDILLELPTIEEKNQLKKKLDIILGLKVVLFVGSFVKGKGVDSLLKCWKIFDENHILLLIGEGEEYNKYLNTIKQNGYKNVRIIPFLNKNDLFEYYRLSDLFVFPTHSDVWGLVINEAMASGLPVITTKNCLSGFELIKSNGFLYEQENEVDLIKKMKIILNDDLLRKEAGEKSLKIIQNYSIENMAAVHNNIFKQGKIDV